MTSAKAAPEAPSAPTPDGFRVLLISPVHDEADHIERVVRAVAAQTRRPDAWMIVDDESADGSAELLAAMVALSPPFARLVRTPPGYTLDEGDRNAAGGPDRAWNYGLSQVRHREFTHIGKLDGDIVLPPNYLEQMLDRFRAEPSLGMAGGAVTEWRGESVVEDAYAGRSCDRAGAPVLRGTASTRIGGMSAAWAPT